MPVIVGRWMFGGLRLALVLQRVGKATIVSLVHVCKSKKCVCVCAIGRDENLDPGPWVSLGDGDRGASGGIPWLEKCVYVAFDVVCDQKSSAGLLESLKTNKANVKQRLGTEPKIGLGVCLWGSTERAHMQSYVWPHELNNSFE